MSADVASWPVEQVVTIVVVSVLLNKLRSALCAGERAPSNLVVKQHTVVGH